MSCTKTSQNKKLSLLLRYIFDKVTVYVFFLLKRKRKISFAFCLPSRMKFVCMKKMISFFDGIVSIAKNEKKNGFLVDNAFLVPFAVGVVSSFTIYFIYAHCSVFFFFFIDTKF